MNRLGNWLTFTSFGESHGAAIGGVIDGFPERFDIDFAAVRAALALRSPNTCAGATQRIEPDEVEWLSGLEGCTTTGAPIAFLIRNTSARPSDYANLSNVFRPSHADYTYFMRYGTMPQTGGGRASARITAAWVVAGSLAQQWLATKGISIYSYVSKIGNEAISTPASDLDLTQIESNQLRCPDAEARERMLALIESTAAARDTIGGIVTCVIKGMPAGVGHPLFGKLQAMLAHAMLSIPAAKGFEYGTGFSSVTMRGSTRNDAMRNDGGRIVFTSNNEGGIAGGITTGQDVYFNVVFKPISSIGTEQQTVTTDLQNASITIGGRHDVCAAPRAASIVKALTAFIITDAMLGLH